MIKANIEGKEVELKPEDLKLGDGFALITPDNVPKGYFTQEALDNVVKDRLSNLSGELDNERLGKYKDRVVKS